MPASESERTGYLKLALTGLISLMVGVASGLILNFATGERPGLEYEVITSEVFSGPVTNLAILAIVIRNTGTDELEDMKMRIDLKNAELREHKVIGLPPSAYSASAASSSLVIDVPYFNPEESASIQLLVALNSTDFGSPSIDVRAKGATGKERQTFDDERTASVWVATAASAMALAPMIGYFAFRLREAGHRLRETGQRISDLSDRIAHPTFHADDQRDVFAYILSINGMFEEADLARTSTRKLSYWSYADLITERCLRSGDGARIKQGIKSLKDLMQYAQIADTSCMLINFDIARMAAAINDDKTAIEHLKASLADDSEIIKKRIQFDDSLHKLAESLR